MRSSTVRLIVWSVFGALILAVMLALFVKPSLFGKLSFPSFSITDISYANADLYTAGGGEVSGVIRSLDIEWINGEVRLERYDGTQVIVEETPSRDAEEALQVHWYNDGGELKIRYAASGIRRLDNINKSLLVKLPRELALAELAIEAVSADITVDGISGKALEIQTVSGGVEAVDIDFEETEVESVSGNAVLSFAESALPETIDADSVSGEMTVYLAHDIGFTVEIDSVSGDFHSDFAFKILGKNRYEAVGRSNVRIKLDSVSGDLNVKTKSIVDSGRDNG